MPKVFVSIHHVNVGVRRVESDVKESARNDPFPRNIVHVAALLSDVREESLEAL